MTRMSKMKRELHLGEWKKILEQQSESGMNKGAWCEAQGINRDQFFYWQRQIREAMIESGNLQTCSTSLVHAGNASVQEFAQININEPSTSIGDVAINMRIGNAELNIMNGADSELIKKTLLAVGKIC